MATRTNCPVCGYAFGRANELAQTGGRCPGCGLMLQIPGPEEPRRPSQPRRSGPKPPERKAPPPPTNGAPATPGPTAPNNVPAAGASQASAASSEPAEPETSGAEPAPASAASTERFPSRSRLSPIAWKLSLSAAAIVLLTAIVAGLWHLATGRDAAPDAVAQMRAKEPSTVASVPAASDVAAEPSGDVQRIPEKPAGGDPIHQVGPAERGHRPDESGHYEPAVVPPTSDTEESKSAAPDESQTAAPQTSDVAEAEESDIVTPQESGSGASDHPREIPQPEERQTPSSEKVATSVSGAREDIAPPVRPTARSLEDVLKAIVKFEVPIGGSGRTQYGCGFLVDARGWVATNHHVVADATTAARARFADGTECRLAGLVASSADHDLAIVKLEDPPPDAPILDISYEGNPPLGSPVYAFGHPLGADFSLSEGVVGRVLTTADLLASSRPHVVAAMKAPQDLVWLQHDAKISPGNSGGPLLAKDGRVVGVNTFLNVRAEFGYASHVRYLRELVDGASEEVTPFPAALPDAPGRGPAQGRPRRVVVSAPRMRQLFDAGRSFAFTPQEPKQYQTLAELAKQMSLAKDLQASPQAVRASPESVRKLVAFTDQLFFQMRRAGWGAEQAKAINQFAVDGLETPGEGAMLYTTVVGNHPGALLLSIDGTEQQVIVPVPTELSRSPRGTSWLVIGRVSSKTAQVKTREDPSSRRLPIVMTHYMLKIR